MSRIQIACGVVMGIIGLFYLEISALALILGKVEIQATPVSIESIEQDGYPDSWYLNITDGYILFSISDVVLEDDGGTLKRMMSPVVSESQWNKLKGQWESGTAIDGTNVALLVSFTGEQVGRLWPDVKEQAEAGDGITVTPIKMNLIGDTEEATSMVHLPFDLQSSMDNFELEQAREMRFERHFNNPLSVIKNGIIAVLLLVFAYVILTNFGEKSKKQTSDLAGVVGTIEMLKDDDSDTDDISFDD